MDRRSFLQWSAASAVALPWSSRASGAARRRPNFIVVLCDDLGYGDIAAMGGKRVRTPHIDRMVREGTLLTDFYVAANLCTPSRAGLLTGRYPRSTFAPLKSKELPEPWRSRQGKSLTLTGRLL